MSEGADTEVKTITTKTQDTLSIVCLCTQPSQKLGKLNDEKPQKQKAQYKML